MHGEITADEHAEKIRRKRDQQQRRRQRRHQGGRQQRAPAWIKAPRGLDHSRQQLAERPGQQHQPGEQQRDRQTALVDIAGVGARLPSEYPIQPFRGFTQRRRAVQHAHVLDRGGEHDAARAAVFETAECHARFGFLGHQAEHAQRLLLQKSFEVADDDEQVFRRFFGYCGRKHGYGDRCVHPRIRAGVAHDDIGGHGMPQQRQALPGAGQGLSVVRHRCGLVEQKPGRALDLRHVAGQRLEIAAVPVIVEVTRYSRCGRGLRRKPA